MQKNEIGLLSYDTCKNNSKWIKDLNVRLETIKLTGRKKLTASSTSVLSILLCELVLVISSKSSFSLFHSLPLSHIPLSYNVQMTKRSLLIAPLLNSTTSSVFYLHLPSTSLSHFSFCYSLSCQLCSTPKYKILLNLQFSDSTIPR